MYGADEAFATGTFAGLLPVVEVDGRKIGSGTIRVAHPHAWLGKRGLTQQLPVRHASLRMLTHAGVVAAVWRFCFGSDKCSPLTQQLQVE